MRNLLALVLLLLPAVSAAQTRTRGVQIQFSPASSTPLGTIKLEPGGAGASWSPTGDFLRVDPVTTGSSPWNMGMVSDVNIGNPNNNNILTFGFNCGTQGQIVAAKSSFCNTTESEFGPTGGTLMEHYLNYIAPNAAASYRLLTFNMSQAAPYDVNVGLVGTTVGLGVGTSINDANRITLNANQTVMNAPSNAGSVNLTTSITQVSFSNGANQSFVSHTSGAVAVRAIAGNLGGADLSNRFTWDATNARVLSANGSNLFQSNNTDARIVSSGTANLIATGSNVVLNSSDLVTVQHGGVRAFQLGSNAEPYFLYGDDNTIGLALSSGAGGILMHGAERMTVASGAGIIFRTNNVNRARFDYSTFRPDTNGTLGLGEYGLAWGPAVIKNVHIIDGAVPSNPPDGWVLYSETGTLKARNSAGTVRTLASP